MYIGATTLQSLADAMKTGVMVQMRMPSNSIFFLPILSVRNPQGIMRTVVARLAREMTTLISISDAFRLARKSGKRGWINWIEMTPAKPMANSNQRFLSSLSIKESLY
jgi:hypothetical protein